MTVAFREDSKVAQSVRAQLGVGGGSPKQGGLKAEEDRDVIRPSRWEGVRPVREVWHQERAGKCKVQDAGAPNK